MTDPQEELAKGRVPLWLDPEDIAWLSQHCCCAADASEDVKDRCGRMRFRANAALHRAALKPDRES